jgi:hypothetical protein
MTALAPILQGFFTDKLIRQRRAGPNTIAAYRDTCRLLLEFAFRTTGHAPSSLDIAEMDAGLVTAFLTHLETARGNTAATRSARLAAIHSLFRYAAALTRTRRAHQPARRAHQPGTGDPTETMRPARGVFPHRRRDRRPAGRARPHHPARPPRPRPAAARLPNRATGLRADRVDPQRHQPRPPRRARPM